MAPGTFSRTARAREAPARFSYPPSQHADSGGEADRREEVQEQVPRVFASSRDRWLAACQDHLPVGLAILPCKTKQTFRRRGISLPR